jgi:PAS domain S-box-containing protein
MLRRDDRFCGSPSPVMRVQAPIAVLLVEDDPGHAALLARRLGKSGAERFELDRAASLGDALHKVDQRKFDVAFVDLSLPDSSGMETVLAVKAADPELPVIVMTSAHDESLEISAMHAGVQDYIIASDSYRPTLRSAIRHAIERQEDLISRQRTEAALKLSETTFRALIESTPDAIFVHRDGLFLYLNPAARELLCVGSDDDLVGKPVSDVILRADLAALGELIHRAGENHAANASCELRFCRADGERVRVADVTALVAQFNGEPAGVMVARDVTDQKDAEFRLALADRLISSGSLAAGISHEINNPLSYIMTNLEFTSWEIPSVVQRLRSLAEEPGAASAAPAVLEELARNLDQVATSLEDCRFGAERISSIIRDLRALGGSQSERDRPIDVRDVLESAINLVWHETRFRCQLVGSCDEVPLVMANTAKLTQVLLSILSNAVDAVLEGNPTQSEVCASVRGASDERVVVAIRDTGPGMPPDVLRYVFDPFYTTKPPGRGRGLGLAISRKIVSDLGGEIEVESSPEQGTTFRVVLPAAAGGLAADFHE